MMKRILVPTDGSACAMIGVRYAVAAAKRYEASVRALHVVDVKLLEGPFLRDISASLGTAPYVNYQGNIALILEERGNAALEAVRALCEEAGVPCETTLQTSLVARAILEESKLADLLVLGRGGEHDEWLDGLVGSTTEAVVRRVSQPVLVTTTDVPGNGRFVLAYDGSEYAKRALQVAATVSDTWDAPLSVLAVGPSERTHPLLAEARSYLEAHALTIDCVEREGDPSETIVEFAAERDADLLVMGSYGHTKVRELVVGSTTAYAMNHAPCPLLLAR